MPVWRRVRVDQHSADRIAYTISLARLIDIRTNVMSRSVVMSIVCRGWHGRARAMVRSAATPALFRLDFSCCRGHFNFPSFGDCVRYPVGVYIHHA
jgi:hypothetical protein